MRAAYRIGERTGSRASAPPAALLPVGALAFDLPGSDIIGLEIPVTGTLAQTATAELYAAPAGNALVRQPDLIRVRADLGTDVGRTDAFAGALWDLTPGTAYDVRVIVRDGVLSRQYDVQNTTRALAADTSASIPTYVITEGTTQGATQAILDGLVPGDIVEFRGRHNFSGLIVNDGINTPAGAPIYIRGDDRNTAIIGDSSESAVFAVRTSNVVIEDLTLLGHQVTKYVGVVRVDGRQGVAGRSPIEYFTLRRCILRGKTGVRWSEGVTSSVKYVDCYQNIMEGVWSWSQIVTKLGEGTLSDTWDDSGINSTGQGHSVFQNTLSGFGDSVKVVRDTAIINTTQSYLRNKVLWGGDDGIELDDAYRNCVAYQNHISNTGTGGSKQPNFVTGGPNYFVRNVYANQFLRPFKLNDSPNGVAIVHNTIVETQNASTDGSLNSTWIQYGAADPRNTRILNNLWTNANPTANRHIWFDGVYLPAGQFDGSAYHPDLSFSFQNQLNPPAGNVTLPNFATAQNEPAYPDGYAGGGFENGGKVLAAQPFAGGIGQFGANWQTQVNNFDETLDGASPATSGALDLPGYDSVAHGALNSGAPRPNYGAFLLSTPLQQAAESLAPGQSVVLSTANLQQAVVGDGEVSNFIQWGSTGAYDPNRRVLEWIGKRESNFPWWRLNYDEATNTWSNNQNLHPDLLTPQFGHGYDHTAVDSITGDVYFRAYNSAQVYHWVRATDTWNKLPLIPGTYDWVETIEYWPGRGLIYADQFGVRLWNGTAWSTIITDAQLSNIGGYVSGEYHIGQNLFIFGGGQSGPQHLYSLASDNTLGDYGLNNAPINISNLPSEAAMVAAPGSNYIVTWGTAGFHRMDVTNGTWVALAPVAGSGATPETGAPNFAYNTNGSLLFAIPAYDVIMAMNFTTNDVWLYKA